MMPRECENASPFNSWYRKLCRKAVSKSIRLLVLSVSSFSLQPASADLNLTGLELADLVLHVPLQVLVHKLKYEKQFAVFL